jgi:tryptophan synthase alpha chain
MTELLKHLRSRSAAGRKLLVPYLVGGGPDRASFGSALEAVEAHADAVEVGLPFSDPLMDGPVIAAAAERALRGGTGPLDALTLVGEQPRAAVPRLAMTYYNPIHRVGEGAFCDRCVGAGIAGLIVPDLPLEESVGLRTAAAERGLAWVPLVAPTSSSERVVRLAETATGFVYAVSTLGVTGTREALSERAALVSQACKAATDVPVLVGIGVSDGAQAREAVQVADGVVIGSAVVSRLDEGGADVAEAFLRGIREALDAVAAV